MISFTKGKNNKDMSRVLIFVSIGHLIAWTVLAMSSLLCVEVGVWWFSGAMSSAIGVWIQWLGGWRLAARL